MFVKALNFRQYCRLVIYFKCALPNIINKNIRQNTIFRLYETTLPVTQFSRHNGHGYDLNRSISTSKESKKATLFLVG